MQFYSRWETISGWRGLLQKNWLVAIQFCVKWSATQIEKHATCKQMHTRLHFRRGDVCTLGPWPSSVAQDKRSCPSKEFYIHKRNTRRAERAATIHAHNQWKTTVTENSTKQRPLQHLYHPSHPSPTSPGSIHPSRSHQSPGRSSFTLYSIQ